MTRQTPTGISRERLTHHIWVNMDAPEDEVKEKIRATLGLRERESVQYLYAQGKNLRVARLSDVENAYSWDLETLRALMGSGALYILHSPSEDSSSSSDSELDAKNIKHCVSINATHIATATPTHIPPQ